MTTTYWILLLIVVAVAAFAVGRKYHYAPHGTATTATVEASTLRSYHITDEARLDERAGGWCLETRFAVTPEFRDAVSQVEGAATVYTEDRYGVFISTGKLFTGEELAAALTALLQPAVEQPL